MVRRTRQPEMGYDPDRYEPRGHHVLFYRAQWEAMPATKELRQKPGLIVPGIRGPHDFLHRHIEHVPAISHYMAMHALQEYVDHPRNHLRSADSVMRAIEKATEHPRATPVEIAVGELAIRAIDLQRPYLREMTRVIH